MIDVIDLKKTFGDLEVLKGINVTINKGDIVVVIGPSGSGKSTVAKMITHLTDITDGKIFFLGKDITHAKGKALRETYRELQMVFQTPAESFDPRCTLGDGIGESLRNMGISKKETRNRVEKLLLTCGLTPEYADRYPHQVSGGECQRAAIARALAVEPRVPICDEATSALDVTVQKQIMELLQKLKRENQLSFLFICHDLALIRSFAHQIAVMYLGNIVEVIPGEDVTEKSLHPYTQALLGAQFSIHMDQNKKIESIESEAPSPLDVPHGCPFQNRCEHCMEKCRTIRPVLTEVESGHEVACHYVTEK